MTAEDRMGDDRLVADRRRVWHDFRRLLFWGPIHAAVVLIVVAMLAVYGPTPGTVVLGIVLIGGNLALTAAILSSQRW